VAEIEKRQQQQQQQKSDSNPNDQTAQAAAEMSLSSLIESPLRELQVEIRDRLLKEQMIWPTIGDRPCNEFCQQGLFSLSFPHLFPSGAADYHNERSRKLELGDYAKHLWACLCPANCTYSSRDPCRAKPVNPKSFCCCTVAEDSVS
jgi:hypothetical protein